MSINKKENEDFVTFGLTVAVVAWDQGALVEIKLDDGWALMSSVPCDAGVYRLTPGFIPNGATIASMVRAEPLRLCALDVTDGKECVWVPETKQWAFYSGPRYVTPDKPLSPVFRLAVRSDVSEQGNSDKTKVSLAVAAKHYEEGGVVEDQRGLLFRQRNGVHQVKGISLEEEWQEEKHSWVSLSGAFTLHPSYYMDGCYMSNVEMHALHQMTTEAEGAVKRILANNGQASEWLQRRARVLRKAYGLLLKECDNE